eukprot:m.165289 g.165289  ORF g.165289 m.165289 type:complete len:190 (+) comp14430_c0_seq2:261-830(+)
MASQVDVNCPICLNVISAASETSCGHAFCGECILEQLQHSTTCPVCRAPIHSVHRSITLRNLLGNGNSQRDNAIDQRLAAWSAQVLLSPPPHPCLHPTQPHTFLSHNTLSLPNELLIYLTHDGYMNPHPYAPVCCSNAVRGFPTSRRGLGHHLQVVAQVQVEVQVQVQVDRLLDLQQSILQHPQQCICL